MLTDLCTCDTPALSLEEPGVCANCGCLTADGAAELEPLEAMAWDVYDAYAKNYDGPGGASIEDRAFELFPAIDADSMASVIEQAEHIERRMSYFTTFGRALPEDGRKPPGFHVHSKRVRPVFPDESYEETLGRDRRGAW